MIPANREVSFFTQYSSVISLVEWPSRSATWRGGGLVGLPGVQMKQNRLSFVLSIQYKCLRMIDRGDRYGTCEMGIF